MSKAIVVNQYGDAKQLCWQEIDLPSVQPNEVLIKNKAVGFNMIDTYFRKGLYPMDVPFVLGAEASGDIVAVGADVTGFAVGDRVACVQPKQGAYAEQRIVPAQELIKIPDGIDHDVVAASLLKGMTAQYLLKQTYIVKAGDTIVVYAAAGGVGVILVQWAKHLGATVIAITGSAEKCALAESYGADYSIDMSTTAIDEIPIRVKELTQGRGVPVVYDSLGKDTFVASLDCLQPCGLLVSYGNATGAVTDISLLDLAQKGSLYVTRPTLFHYIATPESMAATANDLFDVIQQGIVKVNIGQRFALKDAAQAHIVAESRQTTGSTLLIP